MDKNNEWLTQAEVCKILHISQHTLRRLKKEGKIKVSYPFGVAPPIGPGPNGRHRLGRISRQEVEDMMKSSYIQQYMREEP